VRYGEKVNAPGQAFTCLKTPGEATSCRSRNGGNITETKMSKLLQLVQATGADRNPNNTEVESISALTEAELDQVAGGRCIDWMVDGEWIKICPKPQ
jgi:hypothetical protein